MTTPELARTVAALKAVGEILSGQQTAERAALLDALSEAGIKQQEVTLPDGSKLASISVAAGRTTARVADQEAFLEWVFENHPTQIETLKTTRVRPAYERSVLESAKKAGEPIDSTGEVVPGIEVGDGEPYLVTKLADGAHQRVLSAIQAGSIQPLQLPAGQGGAA
jgi:hypothetical protein